MFLFRHLTFPNVIGFIGLGLGLGLGLTLTLTLMSMKHFMELRNDWLCMIGVAVGKHVHGVFPICKNLNTVSLTLITNIK